MVMHLVAVAMKAALAGEQRARPVGGSSRLAQRGAALRTRQAVSATRHEHHHDVIADGEVLDAWSDLFNHARSFVAKDHRRGPRAVALYHREVRMAQPRRRDLNQHLAVLRSDRAGAPQWPAASTSHTALGDPSC